MTRKIDVSHKTIFFITGFLALLWALYQIRDVIVLLFIAIIFMAALSPVVSYLVRIKIPKALAIAVTYLIVISAIAGLFSMVIAPLAEQTTNLAASLPQTLERLLPPGAIDRSLLQQEITNFSKNLLTFTLTIFSNFIALISVAVLTFYLLLERDHLDQMITQFALGREERAKRIIQKIEDKLGAWLRGQLVLSLVITVLVYSILLILGVQYALPLAILAGLLEVVPVIGPIISAIPAVLIAYLTSPVLALMVVGAFFVIQQLENHIIVPQVMKKAVGLNPLIVILAVAIGGKLLGIMGALLAVPIVVVVQIVTEDILKGEEKNIT